MWGGGPTAQPRAITRTVQERIPFTLLVTAPFDLRLGATALFAGMASDDTGVLPIDLHVQLDALLSSDRLATLTDAAAAERAKSDAPVVLEVAGREGTAFFGLAPSAAAVVKHNARETGARLRIVGDAR